MRNLQLSSIAKCTLACSCHIQLFHYWIVHNANFSLHALNKYRLSNIRISILTRCTWKHTYIFTIKKVYTRQNYRVARRKVEQIQSTWVYLWNHISKFYQTFCAWYVWPQLGPSLPHCNMLCTSGLVEDVILSNNGPISQEKEVGLIYDSPGAAKK